MLKIVNLYSHNGKRVLTFPQEIDPRLGLEIRLVGLYPGKLSMAASSMGAGLFPNVTPQTDYPLRGCHRHRAYLTTSTEQEAVCNTLLVTLPTIRLARFV